MAACVHGLATIRYYAATTLGYSILDGIKDRTPSMVNLTELMDETHYII